MRWIIAAALLTGCSQSPAEKAQHEYDMIKHAGASNAELCGAARDVQDAYKAAMDEKHYQLWRITAGTDCLGAKLDRM